MHSETLSRHFLTREKKWRHDFPSREKKKLYIYRNFGKYLKKSEAQKVGLKNPSVFTQLYLAVQNKWYLV